MAWVTAACEAEAAGGGKGCWGSRNADAKELAGPGGGAGGAHAAGGVKAGGAGGGGGAAGGTNA